MSVFSTDAQNTMLDALTCDEIQLHDGDPGSSGTANRVGGGDGEEPATFAAASNGSRNLDANVQFTGLPSEQVITWISVWGGGTFEGKAEISQGDTQANVAGEFTVTTDTALEINDP